MAVFETPRCLICGNTGTVELTADQELRLAQGRLIQEALPELSTDVREQMISGTHPACWEQAFGDDDEGFEEGLEIDMLYTVIEPDGGSTYAVSPDGVGVIWFDTQEEALDALPVTHWAITMTADAFEALRADREQS